MTPEQRNQCSDETQKFLGQIEMYAIYAGQRQEAGDQQAWGMVDHYTRKMARMREDFRIMMYALHVAAHGKSPEADPGT